MNPGWWLPVLALLVAQGPPTFRSRVELIRLDVSVLDQSGQPVTDLRAEDFDVRIDGKTRAVAFARFYGPELTPHGGTPATGAATPTVAPSFATNTDPVQGRVVVFVVDIESIAAGNEKLVFDTAATLVDRLGPADSVGLIVLSGPSIELTRDHARVREALLRLRGFSNVLPEKAMTVREAEAFVNGRDPRLVGEVLERECLSREPLCERLLGTQANAILADTDRRMMAVVTALTTLNANLRVIEAPRTVVFLSGGLRMRMDHASRLRDLHKSAAAAGTTTFVIQIEQPLSDVTNSYRSGSVERPDFLEGLSNVASMTGGNLRYGIGTARGLFDRIAAEVTYSYQLGVESVATDADGRSHSLDVDVRRPGVRVRARREFVVATTPPPARNAAEVLALPPGLSATPLAVSAYNTRGEEPATLKLAVVLESTPVAASEPPSYAFTIEAPDGKRVGHASGTLKPDADGARIIVAAQLAPGRYLLRAAVVDHNGRPGSVELPISVGLRGNGSAQFSDLILGRDQAEGFWPTAQVRDGDASAVLELYVTDPSTFEGMAVDLELRSEGRDAVLARGSTTVSETDLERRRIAKGRISLGSVSPGRYVVSAVVKRGGQPFARISRTIVRQP